MAMTIGIVVVLIGALLGFIATRPANFRIERSAQVNAPANVVFPLINDFHQWVRWSPWEKLDPAMKKTFEGPATGSGSIYSWNGNSKAGEGRMTMLESKPSELVSIRLDFVRPFAATNTIALTLAPAAGGTRVTWTMDGTRNFMFKAMSLFMNMDKLVGTDFERGLAELNTVAQPQKRA